MQATVHRFDPASRSGAVVTDTGILFPFDAAAFAAGRLRHLRLGQRLTITLGPDGVQVTSLRLGTVGVVPPRSSRP
jgi:hypothetical protein